MRERKSEGEGEGIIKQTIKKRGEEERHEARTWTQSIEGLHNAIGALKCLTVTLLSKQKVTGIKFSKIDSVLGCAIAIPMLSNCRARGKATTRMGILSKSV